MKFKKVVVSVLALIMLFSVAALYGCDNGKKIDPRRTQLYVGNIDGAMGREWLDVLKERFEAKYAEVSFEPGVLINGIEKKGVEIIPDPKKQHYEGELLISSIASSRQDIYFTGNVSYEQLVAKDLIEDITDVVTKKFETLNLGDGEKEYSIEDKMTEETKNYYKKNGKYYGLPYATPIDGVSYDVDLFCSKRLYFLKDGQTINGSIDDNTPEELLNGNGLPDTWPRFVRLMDTMVERGVTPFTWSGMYEYTRTYFCHWIWAQYDGYNDYMLSMTFDGTMDNGTKIENGANGYKLAQNQGRLAYAKAAYDLISNDKYYSNNAFKTSHTHVLAQQEYVMSALPGEKPIAMLMESSWWDNEVSGTFDDMVKETKDQKYAQANRRFGMMPAPKFVGVNGVADSNNTESVSVSTFNSTVFINKASKKKDLAKLFLQFAHSNESLSTYNSITGVPKNFKYKMSDSDYNAMSYYQKSVYDTVKNSGGKIASFVRNEKFVLQNYDYLFYWITTQNSVDDIVYKCPLKAFYDNKTLTPSKWYSAFQQKYTADTWPI